MNRRVTPPERATSPTWGPPPPCKRGPKYASHCQRSPFQEYVHPDDHTQPDYELTPGFKPLTNTRLTPHSHQSLKLSKSCLVKQGFTLFSSRKLFTVLF